MNRVVAGWMLEERLGVGGFGEVWRVRRPHADLPRALKLIPVAGESALTSWRHEINRLDDLSHPNIVRFYDAGIVADDGLYAGCAWIATELCERSLADELDSRAGRVLGPEECASLLDAMLGALAAAHGSGCVHRDVKPANILLHHSGVWKLADFGTARLVPDDARHPRTAVVGTAPYMSPAAHRGRQDQAADLYALGVTVHEAACGLRLHRRSPGMSDSEYVKLVLDTPPTISPGLAPEWQTTVAALIGAYGPSTAAELHDWFRRTGGASPPVGRGSVTDALGSTAAHPGPTGAPAPDVAATAPQEVTRTARRPRIERPATTSSTGIRRATPPSSRHPDRPLGPVLLFLVSLATAGALLYAAVPNPAVVLGLVGAALVVTLLLMMTS